MKQTVTIEIEDITVLPLLRNLASLSFIRFTSETAPKDDLIAARLNEIYKELDSSLDTSIMLAQTEAIGIEDW